MFNHRKLITLAHRKLITLAKLFKKSWPLYFSKKFTPKPSHDCDTTSPIFHDSKQILQRLYNQFDGAEPVSYSQEDLTAFQMFDAKSFLSEVIGKVKIANTFTLGFKPRLTRSQKIAWKFHCLINNENEALKIYEQSVQNNKIVFILNIDNHFTCDQSLFIDKKTFLRFKGKNYTFWVIQHFTFYGIYFPNEKIYYSLRNFWNHRKHGNCIEDYYRVVFSHHQQLFDWDKKSEERKFIGLLLSYPRPFHFFTDMLPTTDLLLNKSTVMATELKTIILLDNRAFYHPDRFFHESGYNYIVLSPSEINNYLIQNNVFMLQATKNIEKRFNNFNIKQSYYNKMLKCSYDGALADPSFTATLSTARQAYPLLWMGMCKERRSWLEGNDGICKIVQMFKQIYPNTALIIDGLTATETTKNDYKKGVSDQEEVALTDIKNRLPGVQIINAMGIKAFQKIALAQHVDFFICCYLTDSLYPAQFASKFGIGYGPTSIDLTGHRHPMTVVLPKANIQDVPIICPVTNNEEGVSYSIDPEFVAEAAFNIFQRYQQFKKSAKDTLFCSFDAFNQTLNPDNLSIKITTEKNHLIILCPEPVFTPQAQTSGYAYPIHCKMPYFFRFEAYAKKKTLLYIYGYDQSGALVYQSPYLEVGRVATINFPPTANAFRLFINLAADDELDFFDIHWNTFDTVGNVRLGGDLNLRAKATTDV